VLTKKKDILILSKELKEMRATPSVVNNELENLNTTTITEKVPIVTLLRRPQIGMNDLKKIDPLLKSRLEKYSEEVLQQVEIDLKYESYIEREQKMAEKIESLEEYKILSDFDYDRVKALSSEAREKLKRIRPETIGQMSRISGVSPADVSILTVYLGK